MIEEKQVESNRQAYEKPRLRVITLAAEEVLATGCKTQTTGNPTNPTSCILLHCAAQGS